MEAKFHMTQKENIFLAKRNLRRVTGRRSKNSYMIIA